MKVLSTTLLLSTFALAENSASSLQEFETLSVTATKTATKTKEVSQSISVVDRMKLDQLPMTNINDALQEIPGVLSVSKNGGYDSRLYIRGAGVKANYGIREIMILRDGFPMTDPDSFSRMDFINMEDIKQIEITKGPGSIYASGSAGGTINIIPTSVFDNTDNRIKIGMGMYEAKKAHFKVGGKITENDYLSLTTTYQDNPNTWRNHNEFDSLQSSLKYGHIFKDSSSIETELSYTKSNLALPTKLEQTEFDEYLDSGEITATENEWQNSARDSEIIFFSTKYEKDFKDFTFIPKFFYNGWSHFHPVTGAINDSTGNHVFGTDLQINADHKLLGKDSTLVAGLSFRQDQSIGEKKYEYADMEFNQYSGRLTQTLSEEKGTLAEESDSTTLIYGGYILDTLKLSDALKVDLSLRAEKADFTVDGNEYRQWSWSTATYAAGDGEYSVDESFTLISSKIGTNYAVSKNGNVYANVSYADQVPSSSELKTNISNSSDGKSTLTTAKSFSTEIGYKHNAEKVSFEGNVYYNPVTDFITAVPVGYSTDFENASRVDKLGSEMQVVYRPLNAVQIGTSYSYSDYKFTDYVESGVDYSGNQIPHVPKHQYTVFGGYIPAQGFSLYLQSITWGEYYADNGNEGLYEGFQFVTNVTLGYKIKNHAVKLMVSNVFDQHHSIATGYTAASGYTAEAFTYTPAAPINAFVNYTYSF